MNRKKTNQAAGPRPLQHVLFALLAGTIFAGLLLNVFRTQTPEFLEITTKNLQSGKTAMAKWRVNVPPDGDERLVITIDGEPVEILPGLLSYFANGRNACQVVFAEAGDVVFAFVDNAENPDSKPVRLTIHEGRVTELTTHESGGGSKTIPVTMSAKLSYETISIQ